LAALGNLSLTVCAILGLSLSACSPDEEQHSSPPQASGKPLEPSGPPDWLGPQSRTSPAQWLASREEKANPSTEHPVAEYERLLSEATNRFQEEPRMIANRAAQLQAMLAANGVEESVGSVIEALTNTVGEGRLHGFGELCQHYYNLRAGGYNRQDALKALRKAHEGQIRGD
jgi:hypothetical protein